MARGWERWTRAGASAIALLGVALIIVDYEFFGTMAAAFEQGDQPTRWVFLPTVVGGAGAILIHRWPATGVASLFAAAVIAGLVALIAQPTHLIYGSFFLAAALLAMIESRPRSDPSSDHAEPDPDRSPPTN